MSLDGFIAGPEHEMDWIFEHGAPDGARDVMLATGAIVAGRNTYGVNETDTGKPSSAPYGGAWSGPIFELVHIAPVVLGKGIAFSPGSGRVDLELIDSTPTGGLVSPRYRAE